MKREKIINNTGFILVETLIVGVFIMGIFSLLYTNFFPLIGEYERYKNYDTVESTYIAHWARMIALKGLPDSSYTNVKNTGYLDISDCSLYTVSSAQQNCSAFMTVNNVSKIYLTTYSTSNFKNFVKDVNDILKVNGYKDGIFFDEFQRNSQNYLYQVGVKRTENQYKLVLKTYLLLSNQQGKKLVRNQFVVIDKNGQVNYHYNDIVGKYEVGINHDFSTVVNTLPVDKEKEKDPVKFVQALFAENNKTNNGKSK